MFPYFLEIMALIAGGFVIFVIWSATRTKWPIRIKVEGSQVTKHVGLPASKAGSIVRFFTDELSSTSQFMVYATRGPSGALQTRFTGTLDSGTKQRVRNYLISVL